MDQAQLDQEVKSGNAQFIQPPQEQPVTPPPDDTMNQFLGLLTSIRQPLQPLTAAPSSTPKTFPDQIQFEDDGTIKSLWLYINNAWQQFLPASPLTSSGIIAALGYTPEAALGYTPENQANKVTAVTGASDTNYPSEKAVATFITNAVASMAASSTVLFAITSSYSKSSTTPVKMLEVTSVYQGTVRVIVQAAYGYYSGNGHYRIYINGVAAGAQKDFTNSAYTGSDDISVKVGDKIQLYVWSDNASYSVQVYPYSGGNTFAVCGSLSWNFTSY
jgi:hypothetical protein